MKAIQIRGNCQCCGRQQAVVGNTMSKHGYTIHYGWFNGVCSGERHAPMQVSRAYTDKIIAEINAEVPELLAKADKAKAGELTPATIKRDVIGKPREKEEIPFADATPREQRHALHAFEWNFRLRAKAGEDFAKMLGEVADKIHGTALVEVAKKEAPEFIMPRDQKLDQFGNVCTCTSVQGARVYYKYEKNGSVYKTWMGSQAWRKLAKV
jgi:hypothetical protein